MSIHQGGRSFEYDILGPLSNICLSSGPPLLGAGPTLTSADLAVFLTRSHSSHVVPVQHEMPLLTEHLHNDLRRNNCSLSAALHMALKVDASNKLLVGLTVTTALFLFVKYIFHESVEFRLVQGLLKINVFWKGNGLTFPINRSRVRLVGLVRK